MAFHHIDQDIDKTKNKKQNKTVEIPDSLKADKNFIGTWKQWIIHRSEIKKKLTQSTMDAQLKKLEKFGAVDASEMIMQSIENGWMGLFPVKENNNNNNNLADIEWRKILQAIHDGFGSHKKLDQATQGALQKAGGLGQLQLADKWKSDQMKKNFIKILGA